MGCARIKFQVRLKNENQKSRWAGIRTNAKTKENSAFLEKSGAESGALEVLERWPYLSPSQIEAILSIVREGA